MGCLSDGAWIALQRPGQDADACRRVAAQFVQRMFRSASWFDLTWFWRNDGRRALQR
jgi:hypothetical protein